MVIMFVVTFEWNNSMLLLKNCRSSLCCFYLSQLCDFRFCFPYTVSISFPPLLLSFSPPGYLSLVLWDFYFQESIFTYSSLPLLLSNPTQAIFCGLCQILVQTHNIFPILQRKSWWLRSIASNTHTKTATLEEREESHQADSKHSSRVSNFLSLFTEGTILPSYFIQLNTSSFIMELFTTGLML